MPPSIDERKQARAWRVWCASSHTHQFHDFAARLAAFFRSRRPVHMIFSARNHHAHGSVEVYGAFPAKLRVPSSSVGRRWVSK